jgi:hypothetical protein
MLPFLLVIFIFIVLVSLYMWYIGPTYSEGTVIPVASWWPWTLVPYNGWWEGILPRREPPSILKREEHHHRPWGGAGRVANGIKRVRFVAAI